MLSGHPTIIDLAPFSHLKLFFFFNLLFWFFKLIALLVQGKLVLGVLDGEGFG